MQRRLLFLGLVVVFSGSSTITKAGDRCRSNSYLGKPAPELVSQPKHWINADGQIQLRKLKGKVVWLQFNFCESCTPMRHDLVRWHKQYADRGLVIIEIDSGQDDSLDWVREHVKKKHVKHLVLWDQDGKNHKRYGIRAWPSAYLLGPDGRVIWQGNPARVVHRPQKLTELLSQIEAALDTANEDPDDQVPLRLVADEKVKKNENHVELNVGDLAPDFEGIDDHSERWKSANHVGQKYIVLYFYPADFTLGCTRQALNFRENSNALAEKGIEVVGVSGDSVNNHELFKKAWKLNFTLLSDEPGEIAKKFGVPAGKGGRALARGPDRKPLLDDQGKRVFLKRKTSFARWTFVIGKDGKIVYKNTKVRPAKDSQQVLEFIKKLEKQRE